MVNYVLLEGVAPRAMLLATYHRPAGGSWRKLHLRQMSPVSMGSVFPARMYGNVVLVICGSTRCSGRENHVPPSVLICCTRI